MLIELDRDLMLNFITDLAQGLYDYDEIAERYGFGDVHNLFQYLQNNEQVRRLYQRHRAAYESDDSVEKRVRVKAGLAVEALIPQIASMVAQPNTPHGQKIDGFHKLMRAAGTDGAVAQAREGSGGGSGTTFTLNFVWSDGTKQQISGQNAPSAAPMGSVTIEHDLSLSNQLPTSRELTTEGRETAGEE